MLALVLPTLAKLDIQLWGKRGPKAPLYISYIYVYDIECCILAKIMCQPEIRNTWCIYSFKSVATCRGGICVKRGREIYISYKKRKSATPVVRIIENNQDINLSATALPSSLSLSNEGKLGGAITFTNAHRDVCIYRRLSWQTCRAGGQ